jgi:hypothetical protein
MTLRELVGRLRLHRPVLASEIVAFEHLLPEIEAAVEGMDALANSPHITIVEDTELRRQNFKLYGEVAEHTSERCGNLVDAYRAAKERRGDAKENQTV